jgi:DNA-binding NtrC family response regulator
MKPDVKVGKQLLLVENEAPLRRSLENFLEIGGYEFRSCSTAREALMLAELLHPDVVIVEYRLPDACGVSVVESIERTCSNVASVVISEYDFQWIAKELRQANIHYFLKKPFDPVELETVLHASCSKSQAAGSGLKREISLNLQSNLLPLSWTGCPSGVLNSSAISLKPNVPVEKK